VNALDFIASLVSSLAWPVTILGVAWYFRRGIAAALARPIRRMRAGPVVAEWEEQAAEAAVDVAKSPESGERPPPSPSILSDRLRSIAEQDPRAAVMSAYAEIEQALRRKLIAAGYVDTERRPAGARQLANEAVRRELVSPQISQAVDGLTVLRNLAAHGPTDELDSRKALDYLVLADGVLYAVEAKAASPRGIGQ
jgi:hypothetical protein